MRRFFASFPIPVNAKTSTYIVMRVGKVDHAGKLAVASVIGVEVPFEFLQRPVSQYLKLLHVGYVKAVMLGVYLVNNCGKVIVDPLKMLRPWQPA